MNPRLFSGFMKSVKLCWNSHERALWKQRRRSVSPGKRNRRDVRPVYHHRHERGRNGSKYDRK